MRPSGSVRVWELGDGPCGGGGEEVMVGLIKWGKGYSLGFLRESLLINKHFSCCLEEPSCRLLQGFSGVAR